LEEDKEMLVAGANTMLQIALKLLNKQQKPNGCQELEDEDTRNQRD
jgi:ArsR family metal-binding transcriptional regulator